MKGHLVVWILLSCALALPAGEKVWDGGGKTEKWSDAANWKPNGVPKANADVFFDATSAKDCTIDKDVSVASITFAEVYLGTVSGSKAEITISAGDFSDKKGKFAADDSTIYFTGKKDQTLYYTYNDEFHCVVNAKTGGKLVFFWHTITMEIFRAMPGTVTELCVARTLVTDLDLRGTKDKMITFRTNDSTKTCDFRLSGKQQVKYVKFRNIDAHAGGFGPKKIKAAYGCIDEGGNLGIVFGAGAKKESPNAADKNGNAQDVRDDVAAVPTEREPDIPLTPVAPLTRKPDTRPKKLREAQELLAANIAKLQKDRNEKMRKLTRRYISELEKDRIFYTKKEDLDSAMAVQKEIDNLKALLEKK